LSLLKTVIALGQGVLRIEEAAASKGCGRAPGT
jgi:hypothetical protein